MKKPSNIIFKLKDLGLIQGIYIDYKQTGTDTADTFCVITGSNGECKGKWGTYEDYLDVNIGYNHIAKLKDCCVSELAGYKAFEEENKKDLAEYERLKLKFAC
tara:strand:+ start:144 stop:452 length:309 start_codon:yes stop_codon:yes gene_type:complete